MKIRFVEIAAAIALSLAVAIPVSAQPKVKAKDVPTEQDRCVLSCDAKERQCVQDGQAEDVCRTAGDACRVGCGLPAPTPTP